MKRAVKVKLKEFFIILKKFSDIKNCLRPQSASLTNFEIQKYYQNQPRSNDLYSRDTLPKIKDGTYVINLDEYSDTGTHWIAF